MVISSVGLDVDTTCTRKPGMLGLEGFSHAQGHLVRDVQVGRCMILEKSTTMALFCWTFFTAVAWKAARVCTAELVGRDTVTRLKIVTTNSHFQSRLLQSGSVAHTNAVLFRKSTGYTLGGITSGGLVFMCSCSRGSPTTWLHWHMRSWTQS
jgi:hypothetical protein